MPFIIAGIAGSLRKDSFNKKLLHAAMALCPAEAAIEELDWSQLPIFNQDLEANFPAVVTELKNKIRAADAVLFVTPEYNFSLPGSLKNTIDWASRPYGDSAWRGKPVAIMGASVGAMGTVRAQVALRQTIVFLNMPIVQAPEVFVDDAAHKFDEHGNFTDEKGKEVIVKLLGELIALTKKMKG